MKLRGWMLVALPFALVACAGEEADDDLVLADSAATMTADTTASMASMPTTLALQPTGGSNVSGQATITDVAGQSNVNVQLNGLSAGAHAGHIHTGTCEAPGSVVQPLPEITAGADGAGMADTTVTAAAMTFMDGQHIVAYHEGGSASPGATVTCGVIVAHQM